MSDEPVNDKKPNDLWVFLCIVLASLFIAALPVLIDLVLSPGFLFSQERTVRE